MYRIRVKGNLPIKTDIKELHRRLFMILCISIIFCIVSGVPSAGRAAIQVPRTAEAVPYSITICKNVPAIRGNPIDVNITIPDNLTVEFGYLEVYAYCDPDDTYARGVKVYIDGVGGPIGMECVGVNQYIGDVLFPGGYLHRYYNLEAVKFGGPNTSLSYFYHNFIPTNSDYEEAKLTPGNHTVRAWITNDPWLLGDEVESKLTMIIWINQQPPNSDGTGSDSDSGSPDSGTELPPKIYESLSFIITVGAITFVIIPAAIIIGLVVAARRAPKLGDVGEAGKVSGEKKASDRAYGGLIRCPQCGVYNTASARICIFCGFMLKPARRGKKRK